ncbi:MAG: 5-formyltetrahydrofolate cyclo-ligase [Oscillospiraceae bacterium]|jgi:5-formyltetrahydrofolate cyclo-ligase|nr:5-formyltetrahydrofolate cyclo-ligase [Oscillospiraceae bacterium]
MWYNDAGIVFFWREWIEFIVKQIFLNACFESLEREIEKEISLRMKKLKINVGESGRDDIAAAKLGIRKIAKEAREELNPQEKAQMEDVITERVVAMKEYKSANIVLAYFPNALEVSTREILQAAWNDSKIVGIPRCDKSNLTMKFYAINSCHDIKLDEDGFGVPANGVELTELRNSVCIVPAMVCDYRGYRIGYGFGYYDRFLEKYRCPTIAVCFSAFVQRSLPRARHDIKVNYIVTEKFTKQMGRAGASRGLL